MRVKSADGADPGVLRRGEQALQAEMNIATTFPAEVEQEAADAAKHPTLPQLDRTDIPFVTIDPEGSHDLDQALHLQRRGTGYTVHYAIADVAAFVKPGGAVDEEANTRGETLYGIGDKVPLHPLSLSEGACSLLADGARPALLWTVELDETGAQASVRVERAMVRNRARLSYAGVHADLKAGKAYPVFDLLREVGEKRLALERARGGVSLPLPDQEIDRRDGRWMLDFRQPLTVENWNAQISLVTGRAAAQLMIEGKVGVLRTVPPADPRDITRLHRIARALRIDWPDSTSYPDFIRGLDPARPNHAAMLNASARLLRGAAYASFDGTVPEHPEHAALATTYAHVTAPLRRLVDRYAGEICIALCRNKPVPEWVTARLEQLPETMRDSGHRASQYEAAVVDLVEAAMLADDVGKEYDAVVIDVDEEDQTSGKVMVAQPAVEARVSSERPLPLGEGVRVRLAEVVPEQRKVRFEL